MIVLHKRENFNRCMNELNSETTNMTTTVTIVVLCPTINGCELFHFK